MKKMKHLSFLLCVMLLLQCVLLPVSAAQTEDTEPSQTTASTQASQEPAAFGTVCVQNGCRTIEGMVPLGGSDKRLETAQSAFLYEVSTDTVVYFFNPDMKLHPGTLAKIVLGMVVLENCELDEVVTVTEGIQSYVPGTATTVSEKLKSIQATDSAAAQQLADSEARMAKLQSQKKELTEAIWAGKDALRTTNQVLETLDSAKGWSTWDIVGGGLLVDIAKHRELDHAQEQVEQLQIDLRRFKTELVDVEITAELQVSVDGFLKFADFFFDGLFADWAVLDHIKQAQEQVQNTEQQIEQVLAMLNTVQQETETNMAQEMQKQEQLAVNTVL